MEEKEQEKTIRMFGFPVWMQIAFYIVALAVIFVTAYRFALLTPLSLVITMLALFCVCDIFRMAEKIDTTTIFGEQLDEMQSQINCLDQENCELRNVVRNYEKSEKAKKQSKKQPKTDD